MFLKHCNPTYGLQVSVKTKIMSCKMINHTTSKNSKISFHLLNEPGLGAGIDPGMALAPFPSM